MIQPPPASPGDAIEAIDTPALLLDLDALEANIARMQALADQCGVRLRPHAKSHKSLDIARRQIAGGAVGQCCQKVSEAEVLVKGGIRDVLVSNQVVGRAKLERLVGLAGKARLGVCVDDADNLAELAALATEARVTLDVYVEIDVGMGRCGIAVGEVAVALCRQVVEEPALNFAGLQAYHGRAQHVREHAARRRAIDAAGAAVREMLDRLAAAGIPCPVVTGAGTGTAPFEAASGLWTELQAGSYALMDVDYGRNLGADGEPVSDYLNSLFVLTTVMSVARCGRAVCDAGLKALAVDSGLPLVAEAAGVDYVGASDEHGVLALAAGRSLLLGTKLRLVPGHCDPTVNLHDWYVAVRRGVVEAVWPVSARGAVF